VLRVFHHYIPASIIWLILIELGVLYASVHLGIDVRFSEPFGDPADKILLEPIFPKALSFTLAMWFSMRNDDTYFSKFWTWFYR